MANKIKVVSVVGMILVGCGGDPPLRVAIYNPANPDTPPVVTEFHPNDPCLEAPVSEDCPFIIIPLPMGPVVSVVPLTPLTPVVVVDVFVDSGVTVEVDGGSSSEEIVDAGTQEPHVEEVDGGVLVDGGTPPPSFDPPGKGPSCDKLPAHVRAKIKHCVE